MKFLLPQFLQSTDKRSDLLKKNIIGSLLIKGISCIIQFLLVPVTLHCLSPYEYGIWLTLNSILLWIDNFDIGLGNGLRNKLAESLAQDDTERGRRQVSTTFFMLIGIVVPLLLIICALINGFDMYALLNVDKTIIPNLDGILMASFAVVSCTFVLKIVGNVYLALQLPAINNLLVLLGHSVALFGLWILSMQEDVTLGHVAMVYTTAPLIIYLLSYPVTFTRYRHLRPSLTCFDRKELRALFSLGFTFFFIQLGALVLFASSNILISNLFSPKEVTPYQIAHRYFGVTNIIFTVISAPLWSATTDAFTRGDTPWIRRTIKKMRLILLAFFAILLFMLCIAQPVYRLWVGTSVSIPTEMSVAMCIYMFTVLYGTCYSNIICGIGRIRLLTTITLIEAIVFIPLAIYLSHILQLMGIVAALLLVNLVSAVINRVQYGKLIEGTAQGIWNK